MTRTADRLTVTQLQEQIFAREGFRVSFDRLGAADTALPAYSFVVMAPGVWRVSDWQRVRLASYVLLFRRVTVYRGDGTLVKGDLKLARLRDTYYEAQYGTLAPDGPQLVVQPRPLVGAVRATGKRRP